MNGDVIGSPGSPITNPPELGGGGGGGVDPSDGGVDAPLSAGGTGSTTVVGGIGSIVVGAPSSESCTMAFAGANFGKESGAVLRGGDLTACVFIGTRWVATSR